NALGSVFSAARTGSDGVTTLGDRTFSSDTANFQLADVGQGIEIGGSLSGSVYRIAEWVDAKHVILDGELPVSANGVAWMLGGSATFEQTFLQTTYVNLNSGTIGQGNLGDMLKQGLVLRSFANNRNVINAAPTGDVTAGKSWTLTIDGRDFTYTATAADAAAADPLAAVAAGLKNKID